MDEDFQYNEAFKRNLGWITEQEAETLKNKRVAIAGVGGVGGSHAITLARLGIGKLTIADPDTFELANFNRQAGAMMSTIGESKVDTIARMVADINPQIEVKKMKQAVGGNNIDEFLEGVDLYIDGLDFWAFEARRDVFKKCREKGIPAITVAPLGMGAAFLAFHPKKMSFESYFGFGSARDKFDRTVRFLIGLSPRFLQISYLVDRNRIDSEKEYGPSTPMACQLCAGVACTEALKILLNRGKVAWAPYGYQFDAYKNKLIKTWRPGGFYNPLQQIMYHVVKRSLKP